MSPVVIDEISLGDKIEVAKRLAIVDSMDVLETSSEAESLMDAGILPAKAVRDAAHIAVAAVHGVDYLLTWNCRHLANAQIVKRIQRICDDRGFGMPLICTPEELLEETEDEG